MGKKIKNVLMRWESILAIMLVLEVVIFGAINPKMLKPRVLLGSINNFMPICIISLFVTFVMITGGIDIQAGAIVGLSSIMTGVLWYDAGMNIWAACVFALITGALCGTLSGFFVAYCGVEPMVVTLGGSFLYSGLGLAVSNLSSVEAYKGISGFPEAFTAIAKGRINKVVPYQLIIFLVLIVIAYLLLHRTTYGRKIFLCGINRHAAEYCGINTRLVTMSAYTLSGLSAALAGILLTAYLGTSKSDLGAEYTMPIITAVVLGGTSNTGGKGSIIGTALAALCIGILRYGLSMAGLATQYLDIPVGLLLVVSVTARFAAANPKIASYFARIKKGHKKQE